MKKYNLFILLLMLFSACQKDAPLIEELASKRITVQYFALSNSGMYKYNSMNTYLPIACAWTIQKPE